MKSSWRAGWFLPGTGWNFSHWIISQSTKSQSIPSFCQTAPITVPFPTKSRKPPATLSACNWSDIWPRWYRKTGKAAGKPLLPAGFSPYPLKRETLKSSQRSPGRHWTATPLRRSLPLQNRPCSAPGMYFGKPWIFLPFPQTVRGKPL